MFFLLYSRADDGVFDDFAKISDHFPEILEDSPKLVRRSHQRGRAFSEHFPKITEDCRRIPKKTRRCFHDAPTNLRTISETNLISVKSSISSLVRI